MLLYLNLLKEDECRVGEFDFLIDNNGLSMAGFEAGEVDDLLLSAIVFALSTISRSFTFMDASLTDVLFQDEAQNAYNIRIEPLTDCHSYVSGYRQISEEELIRLHFSHELSEFISSNPLFKDPSFEKLLFLGNYDTESTMKTLRDSFENQEIWVFPLFEMNLKEERTNLSFYYDIEDYESPQVADLIHRVMESFVEQSTFRGFFEAVNSLIQDIGETKLDILQSTGLVFSDPSLEPVFAMIVCNDKMRFYLSKKLDYKFINTVARNPLQQLRHILQTGFQ